MNKEIISSGSAPIMIYLAALPAFFVTACFVLLRFVTVPVWFGEALSLPFIFVVIFYWSVFYPRFMPTLAVFLLGLALDFLFMGPMGLHAAVFLVVQRLVFWQRPMLIEQSFARLWFVFSAFYFVYMIMLASLMAILGAGLPVLEVFMLRLFVGVLSFPALYAVLHGAYRFYMRAEKAIAE